MPTNTSCAASDPGPGNILDLAYNFNLNSTDNGDVASITNNRDNNRNETFQYDDLNRLMQAYTQGGYSATPGMCWGETFYYDNATTTNSGEFGNLTKVGVSSSPYTGCTQDALNITATSNNQISATGMSYDSDGNVTADGVNTYAWNAESEQKTANNTNYVYDGDGNRLYKATGTTPTKIYWYGAGTEILDESDGNGNISNEYAFFGGKRIAMDLITSGSISSTYYYADDFLGSSRTMVQAGGTAPCFDADFLPFGREKDNVATCTQNDYKFEGKERDTETGNDDFGARYYSSNFGRWLSPDWSSIPEPVPYANLTNPQTLNLYAMVQDNPESFADLDGHVVSGDPKNGYCNVVNGDGACDDGELGTIFNNRLSAAPMNPAQLAAFIDYVGQADEPYAYDPLTFNPKSPKDRTQAFGDQTMELWNLRLKINPAAMIPPGPGPFQKGDGKYFLQQGLTLLQGALVGLATDGLGDLLLAKEGAAGGMTSITDVTRPGSTFNLKVDMTVDQFGKNLEGEGYTRSAAKDGAPQFTKGDKTYTFYPKSDSTGGPSVQVTLGGKVVSKLRLDP